MTKKITVNNIRCIKNWIITFVISIKIFNGTVKIVRNFSFESEHLLCFGKKKTKFIELWRTQEDFIVDQKRAIYFKIRQPEDNKFEHLVVCIIFNRATHGHFIHFAPNNLYFLLRSKTIKKRWHASSRDRELNKLQAKMNTLIIYNLLEEKTCKIRYLFLFRSCKGVKVIKEVRKPSELDAYESFFISRHFTTSWSGSITQRKT
jgi:hypothetical protein